MSIFNTDHPKNESLNLPKVIAVLGPTASGKTNVALQLARRFGGEIIVADSRQIYRGVNISSNKTSGEMVDGIFHINGIPYHGLNLVEPNDVLTVQEWKRVTLQTIESILSRERLPIIEGGTGLYVSAVLDNYDFADAPPDPARRKKIQARIKRNGLESVAHDLLQRDPAAADFLDTQNPRRVVRALEVMEMTGRPYSEQRGTQPKIFDDLRLGIKRDIAEIDDLISRRAAEQFDMGLEKEAKSMLKQYGTTLPAMSSIGYLEWQDYFDGKIDKDEVLIRNIKRNKKLARAQIKWLKRDDSIRWITAADEAEALVTAFLN